MKSFAFLRALAIVALLVALLTVSALPTTRVAAQSGRQPEKKKVEKKVEEQKGNPSAQPESQEPVPPMPKATKDDQVIKLSTAVVNVDVTVIDKKSGRIYNKLTQKNFTVYEDGVKQEITNFRNGEGPMTAVLLLENNRGNHYLRNYFDPSFAQEIFQAAATFVDGFVRKDDQVALVTFAMKPKVVTDFTGDRSRLHQGVVDGYRDMLNFRESCLWDALSFALLGGKAIQLFDEENGPSEYNGLSEIEGHTAVILISLGMDTFSKITYDKAMKIVARAGVPIYSIHTGHLYDKKYGDVLGGDWHMNFLQAQNALKTFATYSGGAYFPMTFQAELPAIMQSISAMLRTQYNVGYAPTNTRREGKERKIKVDVDIDGDGVADNKNLDLKFRERYVEPDDRPAKK
jgi:Ca-activated chloride channel family protein